MLKAVDAPAGPIPIPEAYKNLLRALFPLETAQQRPDLRIVPND